MHDKMEYVKSPRRGCGRTAEPLGPNTAPGCETFVIRNTEKQSAERKIWENI